MKLDPKALATLHAVIMNDLAVIARIDDTLRSIQPGLAVHAPEMRDVTTAAYLLHNLYNALENSFEQVSRTCENHVTDASQWHRELLDKMFLPIPDVRPAVLSGELRPWMHELRGFRQLFRHSYDLESDATRVGALVAGWQVRRDAIRSSLQAFATWLLLAARAVGE